MTSDINKKRIVLLSALAVFVVAAVWLMFRILDWRVVEVDLSDGVVDVDGKNVVAIDSLVLTYEHFEKVVDALSKEKRWTEKLEKLLGDSESALHLDVNPNVPFSVVSRVYEAAGAAGFRYVCINFNDTTLCLENPLAVELELELEPEIEEEEELDDQDEEGLIKDPVSGLPEEKREAQKAAARARAKARAAAMAGVLKYALEGWESEDSGLEVVVSANFVLLKARSAVFSEGDSMSIAIKIGDEENVAFQLTQKLAPAMASPQSRKGERPETIRVSAEPGVPAVRVLEVTMTVETILDERFGTQVSVEDGESHGLPVILAEAEVIHVSGSSLSFLNDRYDLPEDEMGLLIPALDKRLDKRRREVRHLGERYGIESRSARALVCESDATYSAVFVALYHFTRMSFYNFDLIEHDGIVVPGLFRETQVTKTVSQDIVLDPKGLSIEPAVIETLSLTFFGEEPDWEKTGIPSKPVQIKFDQSRGSYDEFRDAFDKVQLAFSRSRYASVPYQATVFCEDGVPIGSLANVLSAIRVSATKYEQEKTARPKFIRLRPQILFGRGDRKSEKAAGVPISPIN